MYLMIPTFKKFDLCVKAIESAQRGIVTPSDILIWDNSGGGFNRYLQDNNIAIQDVTIVQSPINLGCARSWNTALKIFYENDPDQWVCVANDDIEFDEHTFKIFDRATRNVENVPVFIAGGVASPNAFSLFVTRYDKLEATSGLFDEFFKYPYCEDGDLARRLWLQGIELYRVEGATASHVGSATLKSYDHAEESLHHTYFERNAIYFRYKWGIDHNNIYGDGYRLPFNGDEETEQMIKSFLARQYGE